ncbi:hypothetical protein JHK85_019609 [Glycine max]|nr:hypothetical protein JHK85_019609 [Glycine max]
MGDSQENNKGKSRDKDNYVSWTMEDTNELLHLLVDAMNRGLRDANGSLSKQNVERIILPQLNAKTKFPKTYSHYLSRMKWFRNQYNMMSTLMRNNSGFGWDPIGKTFTAHEDVWKDYLKIVGQNTRYCVIRNTFGRSQFATSENFHKILKALNSLAPDLMWEFNTVVASWNS